MPAHLNNIVSLGFGQGCLCASSRPAALSAQAHQLQNLLHLLPVSVSAFCTFCRRLPVHPSALQLVVGQALESCRAAAPASLPALAQALAATGWPEEHVLAAFQALMDAGLLANAVQQLGQLAQQQPAQKRSSLVAALAAALLDHLPGGAERLAGVSGALEWGTQPLSSWALCK